MDLIYLIDYVLNVVILCTLISLGWRMDFRKGTIPKVSLVLLLIASVFLSNLYEEYYLLIFGVSLVFAVIICFQSNITYLIKLGLGLVIFTTMIDLMSSIIIEAIMVAAGMYDQYWKWGVELSYVISVTLYTLVYHMVICKNRIYMDQIKTKYKVAVLIQSVIFYIMISFLYESLYRNESLLYVDVYSILIISLIGVFYSTGMVLKLAIEHEKLDYANSKLKFDVECRAKQLKYLREKTEALRSFRHDLINHLVTVRDMLKRKDIGGAQKYTDEMLEFTMACKSGANTGNECIDAIVNYYSYIAEKYGTTISVTGKIERELRMEEMDTVIVFGNLLKNAVEATASMERAQIDISVRSTEDEFYLLITNPVKKEMCDNTECTSTKVAYFDHGLGLKNVQNAVNKYGGSFEYGYLKDRCEFEACVMLSV